MNHLNDDKRKWITLSEYVDIETGEVITKSEFERKYYTVKNEKKTDLSHEKYRIIKYTKICREHRQQQLF